MRPVLFVPGLGNSGPGHWQSLWQSALPGSRRADLPGWDTPHLMPWVLALDEAIARFQEPPVLAAHSLGCLAVAHWATRHTRPIHGALLVAPPDPERPEAPETVCEFAPVPRHTLPFPCRVVASSEDPYADLEWSRTLARAWGAAFTVAGPCGHLNAASGHGEWPRGLALLEDLL